MDILDCPAMGFFLEEPEETQLVSEVRWTGEWYAWEQRVVGLHDGILIVLTLDPVLSMVYPDLMLSEWYVKTSPNTPPLPLGFSSFDDYQMFLFDFQDIEQVHEAVLHWLHDDVTLEDPTLFLSRERGPDT